jgi:hypothetical protein
MGYTLGDLYKQETPHYAEDRPEGRYIVYKIMTMLHKMKENIIEYKHNKIDNEGIPQCFNVAS